MVRILIAGFRHGGDKFLPGILLNTHAHFFTKRQEANYAYLRGEVELVRLPDAEGRIAAEGALPYPPGVLCVVPGEIWGGAVLRYFSALEEGINLLPGFAPELQGVYIEEHDGRKQVWCYVIKPRDAQSTLLKGEKL